MHLNVAYHPDGSPCQVTKADREPIWRGTPGVQRLVASSITWGPEERHLSQIPEAELKAALL